MLPQLHLHFRVQGFHPLLNNLSILNHIRLSFINNRTNLLHNTLFQKLRTWGLSMNFNHTLSQTPIITHFLNYMFLSLPTISEINPLHTFFKFLSHSFVPLIKPPLFIAVKRFF